MLKTLAGDGPTPSHRLCRNVATLLQDDPPSDAASVSHWKQARSLIADAGSQAFSRHHNRPGHFTASAILMAPDADAVALILHRKLGIWCQPGGHFEAHDPSVEAAARRECAEEVGVVELDLLHPSLIDIDVHGIPRINTEADHLHFDLRLLFRTRTLHLVPAPEVAAARWVPLAEAHTLVDDSLRRCLARAVPIAKDGKSPRPGRRATRTDRSGS